MEDNEKFPGIKKRLIDDNESKYGKEAREKYGLEAVEAANAKLAGMSEDQWKWQVDLSARILTTLREAMLGKNPGGELAQKACDLHRQWICLFWKEGAYTKEALRALGEMYVADQRFKAFYDDKAGLGAAEFLNEALAIYTK
jgi:hypothetical protein